MPDRARNAPPEHEAAFCYAASSFWRTGMRVLMFAAALALLSSSPIAQADGPLTDLVLSGNQSVEITASDANACYFNDQKIFNGQLTDPTSALIISINVMGTVGDHPAKAADGHPQ